MKKMPIKINIVITCSEQWLADVRQTFVGSQFQVTPLGRFVNMEIIDMFMGSLLANLAAVNQTKPIWSVGDI